MIDRRSTGDSPYDYVTSEQRPVLAHLLWALPAAKEKFEEGNATEAFRLLNAAEHIQLKSTVGVTKRFFLAQLALQMPHMYCI